MELEAFRNIYTEWVFENAPSVFKGSCSYEKQACSRFGDNGTSYESQWPSFRVEQEEAVLWDYWAVCRF